MIDFAKDVQIKWYGKEVMVAATKANISAMKKSALVLERYIKISLSKPGMGRKYKRGKKTHRASSPMQVPALDLGVLMSSVGSDVTQKGDKILGEVGTDIDAMMSHHQFAIGTDVNYGLYLELGTVNMKPRPWLRPALKKNETKINGIFAKANS